MQGTIVRIVADRGFGFLQPEGQGGDIFFHAKALRDLEFTEQLMGQLVEFDVERGPSGKTRASYVRRHN